MTTAVNTKTKWVIDPAHSEISFRVKHLVFSNVRGRFSDFEASIYTTDNDFTTAEIDVWINPASIDTNNESRNTHLKSADFFDVDQFRQVSFSAKKITADDRKGGYVLEGELTMKGISKTVQLDVEFGGLFKDPWGAEKALFSIMGKINRKDWGLNYNQALEAGGVLISEDVWIYCEVQLIKQV
jgi:polyisoprenoid-binding protein YceI